MLDRSVAPPSVSIDRPNLPHLQVVDISDDLSVHILNQGQQPVVLLELVVPVGRYQEPLPGLSYYLFKMITEGTSTRTAENIASTFDFYGSHLEITPTLDYVSIKLYSLSKFFPIALGLLGEMLTDTNFPEKEFNTLKQIRTQQIRQQNAKNNVFASLKFRQMLFGASHPYGRMITEEQSVAPSRSDLANFNHALLTRPQIFLTGLITSEEIATVKDCFSGIAFHNDLKSQSSDSSPEQSATIKRDGSTQASVRLGNFIINRNHEDIHKLKITNELFGGFFGSRLMKNIREDKGLTYGIHSSIIHLKHASYWNISSELLGDKVDMGLKEIRHEIQMLSETPPGRDEFEMVINYKKGKFLGSFDSPFSAHNMMKNLVLEGLDEQYFFDFFDTLQSITPQQISETAQTYLSSTPLLELVVH